MCDSAHIIHIMKKAALSFSMYAQGSWYLFHSGILISGD